MNSIKKFGLITLGLIALPAFAKPMAQRSCSPDDLQVSYTSSVETQCAWKANDDVSMSVTLHADKSVPLISATCIFTPMALGADNNVDAVTRVVGKKSAQVKNLQIKRNAINFDIYNEVSDPNINVLFYLNKTDATYTPGDKIHCTFSATPSTW